MRLVLYLVIWLSVSSCFNSSLLAQRQVPSSEARKSNGEVVLKFEKIIGPFQVRYLAIDKIGMIWALRSSTTSGSEQIAISSNEGQTWIYSAIDSNGLSPNSICTNGGSIWICTWNGVLAYTSDKGQTWSLHPERFKMNLDRIVFNTPNVGFLAGSTIDNSSRKNDPIPDVVLFRTKDGGVTWRRVFKGANLDHVFDIATEGDLVIATLGSHAILRSTDGGNHWDQIRVGASAQSPGRVVGIAISNNGTVWAVGPFGAFYRSDDNGNIWYTPSNLPKSFLNKSWHSIGFNSTGIGIAVGEDSAIGVTTDNGASWSIMLLQEERERLGQVVFQDEWGIVKGNRHLYIVRPSSDVESGDSPPIRTID